MKEKPIVTFIGGVSFFYNSITDEERAMVYALNHPILGTIKVTTSRVLYKFDDGSFETLNTIYKPHNDLS
jgi:hypothetical protein